MFTCNSKRLLTFIVRLCYIFLPLDGIINLDNKISLKSSTLIGLEINKSLYKLDVPKILKNLRNGIVLNTFNVLKKCYYRNGFKYFNN